jgi:hypothetical protein
MNILKSLMVLAFAVACFCFFGSFVKAEEPETLAITLPAETAKAIQEAETARLERQAEAARRAGLSFWDARKEDVGYVWAGTKWVAVQSARGVANADGYVTSVIAIPSAYVASAAFGTAEDLGSAAAEIE